MVAVLLLLLLLLGGSAALVVVLVEAVILVGVTQMRKTVTPIFLVCTAVPILEVPFVSVPSLLPVSAGAFASFFAAFPIFEISFISVPSL